jgi:hypothetical protein
MSNSTAFVLCVALIAALVWMAPTGPTVAAAPMHSAPAAPHAITAAAPASSLTYHANLYVNASAPTGSAPTGEEVGAIFEVSVPGYTGSTATVRIPNAAIGFPSSSGTRTIYSGFVNITVTPAQTTSDGSSGVTRWTGETTFTPGGLVPLSTQGLAVMASWPHGQYALSFRWHWVLTAPDGSSSNGPWSGWTSVSPAQLADLTNAPPTSWPVNTPLQLCLGGPVDGRTFSVHVSTTNPSQQYDDGAVTIPSSAPTPYCWNSTLPSGVTPGAAFVHLWEYSSTTFMLFLIPIQLVNSSPSGPPALATAVDTVSTVTLVLLGVGFLAAVLAIVLFVRPRRRRPVANAARAPRSSDAPSTTPSTDPRTSTAPRDAV